MENFDHLESDGVAGEARAKIPEGNYEGTLFRIERKRQFGHIKLVLTFVITSGEYEGVFVSKFLRAYSTYSPNTDVYKFWVVAKGKNPNFGDRLNLDLFMQCIFEFHVKNVTHDSRREALPEVMQYSVVDRVIQRKVSGCKDTEEKSTCTNNQLPSTDNLTPIAHHLPPTTHFDNKETQSNIANSAVNDWQKDDEV